MLRSESSIKLIVNRQPTRKDYETIPNGSETYRHSPVNSDKSSPFFFFTCKQLYCDV